VTRPDLSTEAGRAAYRAELKAVGRPLRMAGLGLIVISAFVLTGMGRGWFALPEVFGMIAYGGLAAGWALMLAAIFQRTRHHRRRSAEG